MYDKFQARAVAAAYHWIGDPYKQEWFVTRSSLTSEMSNTFTADVARAIGTAGVGLAAGK